MQVHTDKRLKNGLNNLKRNDMKYLVSWIIYNRDSPKWRPIYKFTKCSTLEKADRFKNNLLKQTSFIQIYISKII